MATMALLAILEALSSSVAWASMLGCIFEEMKDNTIEETGTAARVTRVSCHEV